MQVSKGKPKKSETPKDIVALEIEQCKSILGSMSDRLEEFNLSGIDEAGLRKLRKLIKNILLNKSKKQHQLIKPFIQLYTKRKKKTTIARMRIMVMNTPIMIWEIIMSITQALFI